MNLFDDIPRAYTRDCVEGHPPCYRYERKSGGSACRLCKREADRRYYRALRREKRPQYAVKLRQGAAKR